VDLIKGSRISIFFFSLLDLGRGRRIRGEGRRRGSRELKRLERFKRRN
jgi:hypothetical protein